MKMHIKEFAKLTGVSVRTLHYYDEIELLKPSAVDEQNGYRFYDEESLTRMQEILFYRELDFPLKEILLILSSPDYDKQTALKEQKRLLTLKKERLERLITALDGAMKGETLTMNVFDNSEFEAQRNKYAEEAKQKWGGTPAYKESTEKTAGYSSEKLNEANAEMDSIMAEFAECIKNGLSPENDESQALVKKWQDFITDSFYTCTKDILASLGEMYIADERFKASIDKHGDGTAQFMCEAIRIYCR
ncbi:MAG: MerR family transcriptional regulator [Oscillospiraceae bacterium]|nr:MerR family transcriptional regulator [Oscillospiraceae bacterium]